MAPEQARDSRATSIQSDMYSLGCTFYYLLTGVPPFPGGDITDKLTRHAKNPPPDVRDLRPDLPAELSAILLKLMAKRPEDRFASYDELTTAIDAVPLRGGSEAPGITSRRSRAPPAPRTPAMDSTSRRSMKARAAYTNGSAEATIPLASLVELVGEDEPPNAIRERTMRGQAAQERPHLQRDISLSLADTGPTRRDEAAGMEPALPSRQSIPGSAWIIPGVFLCAALVVLGIGVVQFMGASDGADSELDPGRGWAGRSRAGAFAGGERLRRDGWEASLERWPAQAACGRIPAVAGATQGEMGRAAGFRRPRNE